MKAKPCGFEYGPFGEVIRATGPMAKANPFRFSTKYQDDESDLLYYGVRYLKNSTGGWLSRDPIGEIGGINLYGFVGNDPLNHWDVNGRFGYGIHHFITYWAATDAGYSSKCAEKIARAAANTDIWHPLDDAYHFTRKVRGDKAAALQKSRDNRDALLRDASDHGKKGQCARALKDLGRGLHVLEDYYSHVINGEPVSYSVTGSYPSDDNPNHRDHARDNDYGAAELAHEHAESTLSALKGSFSSCCCSD